MLNIKEIHELIKAIDESTIDEFVYENEGASLKLKKHEAGTVQVMQRGAGKTCTGTGSAGNSAASAKKRRLHLPKKNLSKMRICIKSLHQW